MKTYNGRPIETDLDDEDECVKCNDLGLQGVCGVNSALEKDDDVFIYFAYCYYFLYPRPLEEKRIKWECPKKGDD